MIVTPPLLLALFIRSCFDPPFFGLSCSARGRVRPVVRSPVGEGWAGPGQVPRCGTSTARERDFCWEKGRGGSGEKKKEHHGPSVPLCLNKLVVWKTNKNPTSGWTRGEDSDGEGRWRIKVWLEQCSCGDLAACSGAGCCASSPGSEAEVLV